MRTWDADGSEASHLVGRRVADRDAGDSRAWESKVSVETPAQTMLYGPYLELPPGDYVAFFRMKLVDDPGEDIVARIDAAMDNGQTVLATRDVTGNDLSPGRYASVPLAFHAPAGRLECRVFWTGYSSLRVDRITLFRLEGAVLPPVFDRAPLPVPSGRPSNLIAPRGIPSLSGIFPRSRPPASLLHVVDLRREPSDRQLMALCLQGIVNRDRPRIYCLFNATDPDWLARMRKKGWIRKTILLRDTDALLARYRDRVNGLIVTDPNLPASRNVATMLAGIHDSLAVSPRLSKNLAGKYRLPVRADLRGRWRTSAGAYRWAFDRLWPRLSHRVIACSYPDHMGLRDYLVQHRVFLFWISGPIDGAKPYADPTAEARLMERLLARMPVNIPVMSYPWAGKEIGIGEGPGVTLLAEFGKYLVGSIDCSNLSVHSGIRLPNPRRKRPPAPPLQRAKAYVSFVISDGDNLPVLSVHNFPQLWKDPLRGKIPLGWTISPSAAELMPGIVDHYYTTATPNDDILGAVSGVGYTYPDSYAARYRPADRARLFNGFLDQTRAAMKRMDLNDLWIMNATRPESIRRYAERIPSLGALFPDYGRRVSSYREATYPTTRNVPVFHALTNWREGVPREEQIEGIVSGIRAMTPRERPAFLHLFVLNWFADLPMLREILTRLGPGYVAVRPDHLGILYRRHLRETKALIQAPLRISAIEGQPVRFTATVRNVTDRPMAAAAQVTRGLRNASVVPVRLRLAPGGSGTMTVRGIPSGGRIDLEARGAFGVRLASIDSRGIAARELVGVLPQNSLLEFMRDYEAEDLPHRSGTAEAAPDASGNRLWTARVGAAEKGFVVYGPYEPLPKGRYVALFRIRRIGEGSGAIVTLDALKAGGVDPPYAVRNLTAGELPINRYRSVPLMFRHPGGPIETRVFWTGAASLSVDGIGIWKVVEPAPKHGP